MIDGILPTSARKYDVWWSNSPVLGRHNQAWLSRGWLTMKQMINSAAVIADLNDKALWRMIEHTAIVGLGGSEIEIVIR